MPIYKPPKIRTSPYGTPIVEVAPPHDFLMLVNQPLDLIIPFDKGTDEDLEQGRIVLPRYYFLFEGVKDGEIQFKPYEYNQHRVVVATYKGIITEVLSIG